MKVQGTKLLTAISFFVMVAISLPTTAQSTDKANTLTEQRESEKEMDNYLKEIQSLQQQYYPNHNNYFIPIFERAKSAGPEIVAIVKQKIQEALDKYAEVITTPKDQLTVHLMAMELMMPATEFTNHKEVVVIDPERDLDMRQLAANEAVQGVTKHFKDAKERATKENERATKENERATKENERATKEREKSVQTRKDMEQRVANAKANLAKIEARGKEVRAKLEKTIDGMEEYMNQLDITLLPKIPQMQDFVKQYIISCKEIERKPNAVGQKFIDAYQKLQK
ncbi:hypothetical protein [Capnocytophaga canimorsus]|uniref:hypothetical protein n=1 Tax=Capnocytophaga canimorsus TaxID=28188 RepID=UPI001ACA15D8|nr:hypothetical protein [Capnocytophaga canimorsus]GIM59573.1 hypothetical protein CAPN007_17820 [Capnocytophaga canimorsus]